MSSRRADANGLVIGGEPRINFLPPEVMAAKLARRARRSLGLLVVLVLVVCAAGYVFATMLAIQSQLALAQEQERTAQLLSEQSQYSEARSVSSELAAVKNARIVGSANEVLWRAYLENLRATLPSGMQITATAIDSMSATDLVPVSAVPLGDRAHRHDRSDRHRTVAFDHGLVAGWTARTAGLR